jgi:hypothetical protein
MENHLYQPLLAFLPFFSAPQPRQSCPVLSRFRASFLILFVFSSLSLYLSLSPRAPVPHPHTVTRVLLGHIKLVTFSLLSSSPSLLTPPTRAHAPPFLPLPWGPSKGFLYAIAIYPFIFFVFL